MFQVSQVIIPSKSQVIALKIPLSDINECDD